MPRETVGTAIVRILADGKGMRKSIKDAFEDAEPDSERAGQNHSKAFNEGFAAQQKKNSNIEKSLTRSLERAFGRITANTALLGRGFERKVAEKIANSLEALGRDTEIGRRSQEIGDRVAKNLVDGFSKSGSLPKLSDNLQAEIEVAFKQILKEEEDFETEWRRNMRQIDAETARMTKGITQSFSKWERSIGKTRLAMEKLVFAFRHDVTKEIITIADQSDEVNKKLRQQHLLLPQLNKRWGTFSNTVGAFAGRGSRNNFLNFIGSMTRNLTNLIGIVPKIGAAFLDFAGKVSDAGGGLSGILKVVGGGGGLLKMFGKLAGASAGIAIAITAIVGLIVGPLVAALSLALGVVTALAASLTFALIGALAAVSTAFLPFIAGIAVVTGAILSLDDAMKNKLKKSIKPLVDEFKLLGDIAADELFAKAPEQAERLGEALTGLRGLVRGVARAMSDVGDIFLDMIEGPGFKQFTKEMKKFLPDAVRSLGRIFANTLGGIGGMFVAAIPITERFLGWLERITGEFSAWANSEEGRKEVEEFLERAGDSARSIGNFLREVTELLGTIFSGTKGSGDNIFDSMAESVEKFNNFLKENPDALEDWAEDAERFADAVGRLVVDIGKLMDALDESTTRKFAITGIEFVSGQFQTLAFLVRKTGELISGTAGIFKRAFDQMKEALSRFAGSWKETWDRNSQRAKDLIRGIKEFFSSAMETIGRVTSRVMGAVVRFFANAGDAAWDLYQDIMNGPKAAFDKLNELIGKIPGLIAAVGRSTLKIPGVGVVRTAIQGLADGLGTAVGWVETLISALGRIDFPDPPSWLKKGWEALPGTAIGGIFVGPQARLIGEAGPEAVVPLNRPLNQVDPAVRMLSAFAQGKLGNVSNVENSGRTIDASGWTIVSPGDPHAVAQEAVNRLAAAAYI